MSGEQPKSESRQAGDSLSLRLEQLNRQVADTMEEAVRSLAAEAVVEAESQAVGKLLERVAQLDQATDQSGVLMALLEGSRDFASRTAFFLTRSGEVRGWAGHGFGSATAALEGLQFDYADDGVWAELSEGRGAVRMDSEACERLAARIHAPAGEEGLLIPFVLRGQLGGAIYADRLESAGPLGASSLLLLTHCAATALETLAFRKGSSPSLRFSDPSEEAEGVPIWQPSTTATVSAAAAAVGAAAVAAVAGAVSETEQESVAEEVREPDEPEGLDDAEPVAEDLDVKEPVAETLATESLGAPVEEDEPVAVEELSAPEEPVGEEDGAEASVAEDSAAELLETELSDVEAPSTEAAEPSFEMAPEPEVEARPEIEEIAVGSEAVAESIEAPGFDEEAAPEELEEHHLEPTFEELSPDLEPEPELEDTSVDLWATADDEDDEDDEPTAVGQAVKVQPPAAAEPADFDPAAEAPAVAPDAVGQQTVRLDLATIQQGGGIQTTPPVEDFQPPPEAVVPAFEPPALEVPETIEPPPFDPPEEDEIAAEEQTMISRPQAPAFEESESSGGYVPPPPEPAAAAGGSTEVKPPEGLEGPGLAFASAGALAQNEQEEWHEEARRLARLLVSEIKLYADEQTIEEGRRNADIYSRLKEDIDRSRQMYEERINPGLQGREDYFYKELVQRLAGGDSSLLGME